MEKGYAAVGSSNLFDKPKGKEPNSIFFLSLSLSFFLSFSLFSLSSLLFSSLSLTHIPNTHISRAPSFTFSLSRCSFPHHREEKSASNEHPATPQSNAYTLQPPQPYLRRLNSQLTKPYQKRGLAADSTGFGTHRYETWLTVKGRRKRRGYVKVHVLIALQNLSILNLRITKGTRHDSPILRRLLRPIPKGSGDTCLDPAYLSRRNCNLIAKKGRTPFIKPKRNTTIRKCGSQPWREMMTLGRFEDEAAFLRRYHQRSKVESVYSSLKRCYETTYPVTNPRAQRHELHLKTLSYNIGVANLTTISGRK